MSLLSPLVIGTVVYFLKIKTRSGMKSVEQEGLFSFHCVRRRGQAGNYVSSHHQKFCFVLFGGEGASKNHLWEGRGRIS